jgi:hypothetical protein
MATDPKIVKELAADLDNLNSVINDLSSTIQNNVNKSLAVTSESVKDLVDGFDKGENITKKLEGNIKKAHRENRTLGLDQNRLQSQLLEVEKKLNTKYSAKLKLQKESLDQQIKDNLLQQELNENVIDYLRKLDQVNENEKKNTEEKKKQNSLTEQLKNKYNDLTKNFTLPALLKFIIDAGLKANRQTVELGKSFGISYKAANGIRQEFVKYSRAAEDSFVNTDRLLKAQSELTEQLGFAVKFSGKEAETFSRLTEIVGLSAQEAGNLARFSAATGKTTKDYVADVRKAAFFAQQSTKTHFSDKQILQEVSKLSAGILIKFQGNPKAIAEAVVQAKKLGSSLEQINKIGDSMLNWESSIENELEAELITGRKLNFERARAAALTGDQATIMQEVAAQAGSLAEYQSMNVIAQESLAKAFGMNRDEMADMLIKQQAINEYGDKAAELNAKQLEDFQKSGLSLDEYLKKQDEQRNVQEKFNDAMMRLQDILGNLIAGPLGSFLQTITSILDNTILLSGILGGVMVANLIKMANAAKIAKKASMGEAIAEIFKAAYKSLGGYPGIGLILAAAGAAAGIAALTQASSKSVDDGVMSPSGKMLYSGAEGAIKLNDNDTVIAGTNLGGGKGNISSGIDLSPMIAAINEVRNAVNALANKPTNVVMDSQKVGALVGRRAETGTEQTKNSYKLA